MPRKTREQYYEENKLLLANRAWSWAQTSGREFSDLLGVCHEAFMECTVKFVKARGAKFSSLLGTICNQMIIKYLNKHDHVDAVFEDPDERVSPITVEAEVEWNDLKGYIRDEVGSIIDVLLKSYVEVIEEAGSMRPRALKRGAKAVLRQEGYSDKEIAIAFARITQILREARQ